MDIGCSYQYLRELTHDLFFYTHIAQYGHLIFLKGESGLSFFGQITLLKQELPHDSLGIHMIPTGDITYNLVFDKICGNRN